jgi:mono/diheme cytochrome c family protein
MNSLSRRGFSKKVMSMAHEDNMMKHGRYHTTQRWRRYAVAAAIAAVMAKSMACAAAAEPATPSAVSSPARVDAGRTVWKDGGCEGCHGANGQGGTSPDLPAGPSLRASKLDRKGLTEVIACGKPGTQMAAWLKGAYTTTPCYAAAARPVPSDVIMVGAYTATDIEALIDYLQATFVGK